MRIVGYTFFLIAHRLYLVEAVYSDMELAEDNGGANDNDDAFVG